MRILLEASGSLVSNYMIKSIKEAGHTAIASDVDDFCHAAYLADEFVIFPKVSDSLLWEKVTKILSEYRIDVVIPSFDETLLDWSLKTQEFRNKNIHIILSPPDTISIFQDKWKTYEFFKKNNIPTPETSLEQKYLLVKPKFGRGGNGIYIGHEKQNMTNMISQEFIDGKELTVDCFFNKNGIPIYIVPRSRGGIKEGKSTKGITVRNEMINDYITHIANQVKFIGPINFQVFILEDGSIKFIEINPRIAGGMALGFAATENWIDLMIRNNINEEKILPKPIKYNLKMMRYYAECFVPAD